MDDLSSPPTWKISLKQRSCARVLRRNSTDAERIIWAGLRAHRLSGASFRRQTPIGPFIADFVCHSAHLIIEIDGGQHFEARQLKRDAQRSAYLASIGFRVLRFNNHEVMTNRAGVFATIAEALHAAHPLPNPPPQAGEGTDGHGATP